MKPSVFTIVRLSCAALSLLFASCRSSSSFKPSIVGSWRLVSGETITNGVSSDANYRQNVGQIKIINSTHFAYLRHDIDPPKDSSNHFDAGGGTYTLSGDQYTELLQYCSNKNWEGHPFTFSIRINNDTLTQTGVEKVEKEGVDHVIIERYVRLARTH